MKLLMNELEKLNGNPKNGNPKGLNPKPKGPNHALAEITVSANPAPAEHSANIFLNIPVLHLHYMSEGIILCLILLVYLVEIQPV